MVEGRFKNVCKHISFPFLSNEYSVPLCCFKKEYIFKKNTSINRKIHRHSAFEIHFVLEGCIQYEIDDKTILLEAGQIILFLPGVKHRIVDVSDSVKKCTLLLSFSHAYNKTVLENLSSKDVYTGKITKEIDSLLKFLSNSKASDEANGAFTISARAYDLICSLPFTFFSSKNNTFNDDQSDARVFEVKQYIKDNICFNVNCEKVAKHTHLSVKQLSRIFVKYEGITLVKYITKTKTELAEQMLMDDDISIRDVSEKLGFCNEYYFNVFFKKNCGMSPGAYRKTIK